MNRSIPRGRAGAAWVAAWAPRRLGARFPAGVAEALAVAPVAWRRPLDGAWLLHRWHVMRLDVGFDSQHQHPRRVWRGSKTADCSIAGCCAMLVR